MSLKIRELAFSILIGFSLSFLAGCCSLHKRFAQSERPSFFEPEISSRTWIDPDGTPVYFLSATITNIVGHGEFLIVCFGDKNTQQARCLEFYLIKRKADELLHDKFVLLDHDWGPRDQNWWQSVVISVEPVVHRGIVSFQITREPISPGRTEGRRLVYYLDYRAGVGMTPNISEWWTKGP